MPIDYTPKPEFPPWTDQISVVRASGEDGFNARFHSIFAEFVTVSGHLRQIGTVLDRLGTPPVIDPVTMTVMPSPVPIDLPIPPPAPSRDWAPGDGVVVTAPNADQAVGIQPLALPAGAHLKSFSVIGTASGDSLTVARLEKQTLFGTPTVTRIAQVTGTGGDFQARVDIPGDEVVASTFKYRIFVNWNLVANPNETGRLAGFQIVYLPSQV